VLVGIAFPAVAQAHGPTNPVGSDYLARITSVPGPLSVKVIDADQGLWLRAPSSDTVEVLDPRGAAYLRFSSTGVAVNTNSELYYLNQTPVSQTPPPGLTRSTPPAWQPVSGGHSYTWHEGRLHAPAALAIANGRSYVGSFSVPVLVNGARQAISGGVWHTGPPSIVWFWPIAVLLACLLAARRLRDPVLDRRTATAFALLSVIGITLAALGRDLHGRPGLSGVSLAELMVTLAIVAWGLRQVVTRRAGFMTSFVLAFVALWEGITLVGALTHGYVLLAIPALLGRVTAVLCLGGGIGLLLACLRMAEEPDPESGDDVELDEDLGLVADPG
jgi:hypothetical protein